MSFTDRLVRLFSLFCFGVAVVFALGVVSMIAVGLIALLSKLPLVLASILGFVGLAIFLGWLVEDYL